jgi:hypothetical protein
MAIPQHGRLALIGDADRGHLDLGLLGDDGAAQAYDIRPDLLRIVLCPSVLGKSLAMRRLGRRQRATTRVEQHRVGAGSAPIDRQKGGPRHKPRSPESKGDHVRVRTSGLTT